MKETQEIKAKIFAYIFKLSNTLQVYLDNQLSKDGLTAKQFFLMIVINSFEDSYPTFKQAADVSGSSYQNVKQIALKLQRNGYLEIANDQIDKRAKRMMLTKKSRAYWQDRDISDTQSMDILFQDFKDNEISDLFTHINKLLIGLEELENKKS